MPHCAACHPPCSAAPARAAAPGRAGGRTRTSSKPGALHRCRWRVAERGRRARKTAVPDAAVTNSRSRAAATASGRLAPATGSHRRRHKENGRTANAVRPCLGAPLGDPTQPGGWLRRHFRVPLADGRCAPSASIYISRWCPNRVGNPCDCPGLPRNRNLDP